MSLLDQVVGAMAGSQSGDQGNMLQTVMQLLNNPQTGGLSGLVQSLQQGGLGDVVNSWISNGQNQPVSADQIQSALGGSSLQGMAEQMGMSTEQASGSLAELLPQLINQMTPNGQLPEGGNMLAQGMDLLKKGGLFS